jgi:hypothetical protein
VELLSGDVGELLGAGGLVIVNADCLQGNDRNVARGGRILMVSRPESQPPNVLETKGKEIVLPVVNKLPK